MTLSLRPPWTRRGLASVGAAFALAVAMPAAAGAQDPRVAVFPATTDRIHVFDDQLPGRLDPPLLDFVATHLAGAQKLPRSLADQLHARNPAFVVLQYRLGLGLGFRSAEDGCTPTGDPIAILDGDDWVPEWPADPDPAWFATTPGGERPYLCDWGWYLVDTDAPAWRSWFADQVAGQIVRTGADGLFLDSVSPPNQLGTWVPPLPDVDQAAEDAWSRRIERWLPWIADALDVPVIANAGAWVTSRDTTDLGGATGVMIEGFGLPWPDVTREDWTLQMDRVLSITRPGGVLLAQAYPDPADVEARQFIVGSFLLVMGEHSFLNLEVAEEPAWFPEYDLPLGPALDSLPERIDDLRQGDVLVRRFRDATVVVNPGAEPATWRVPGSDGSLVRLVPQGGGIVPPDGVLPVTWRLLPEPADGMLSLGPRQAALLTTAAPLTTADPGAAVERASAAPAQVLTATTDLAVEALHRDGQTFLTWDERAEVTGETYRIHRAGAPLDVASAASAPVLATVGEGSSRIWSDRTRTDDGGWGWRYAERVSLPGAAGPLPVDRGWLAWTPETGGAAWYAVEAVGPDGAVLGTAVVGPVAEAVADPRPIELLAAADGRAHLMLQVQDLAAWNPTFHAPHPHNQYLGLDPADPGIADALAYAYTYVVAEPAPASCPDGVIPDRLPVIMNLHGWGGDAYAANLGPSEYYCAVEVRPVDSHETWWFGFAAEPDFRRGETPGPGDHVVNYTEQRLLRMVHDLLRDPELGPRVDPERVYVYGHSMGGSGTLALALRYPTVFAAAYASEPMTDHARAGDGGGTDWREDVAWKWGTVADDLPVVIGAPGGWADGIARYAGTGVYTWQDHAAMVLDRRGDDSVPLGIAHGLRDTVIEWSTQGEPFHPRLAASGRAFAAAIRDADHTWLGFAGLPHPFRVDDSLVPFRALSVVLHETVPGIREDAATATWPPQGELDVNAGVTWSASWEPWDGPPVDEPGTWSISLRAVDGALHRVAVTPRRLQRFRVEPGADHHVELIAIADGSTLRTSTVTADTDGLLTVEDVPVDEAGVRVRITGP